MIVIAVTSASPDVGVRINNTLIALFFFVGFAGLGWWVSARLARPAQQDRLA